MSQSAETEFETMREEMVEVIAAYALLSSDRTQKERFDARVMEAIARVPRHAYVPRELQEVAYANIPLPIGHGKTISQPFIVALMTDLLDLQPGDRVLEIGTGLGYQAAILAELVDQVYTVEIIEELALEAAERLGDAGYGNIEVKIGDGGQGWPENGPYDKVIVTAAPELIPPSLIAQLKPGGRLVIPAGLEDQQQLMLMEKDLSGRMQATEIIPVVFSRLITAH
ncbi:MAG: protein-L-isoaspartate(D-aspartate) O-methyltransferase [Kiloniellales bacterium]|jgi:protein-L-isoaspartate(D-aspartate) O-methyltransferase|nr:protein-L-isoaspartate(D-aspartate) O-methyltransferase [Kiloniellales bacterium]